VPAASGWASYEPPGKRRKKRGDSFEDCVAGMREGAWIGDDPAAPTYQEALEDERAGKPDLARRGYLQLIQRFPASPYVPLAYLAFGELFAEEAPRDPSKWALVQQTYQKVIEYPGADSGVFAFGQLRLGQAYHQQNEDAKALDLSRQAVISARDARQQCGAQIRSKAVEQAVEAYAGAGQPARALAFFRALVPDEDSLAVAIGMLAEHYGERGRRADSCRVVSALPAPQKSGLVMTFCATP
jgi:hypothetical protein